MKTLKINIHSHPKESINRYITKTMLMKIGVHSPKS